MTTFALESLFEEIRRRTYVEHLGLFQTVPDVTDREQIPSKTDSLLVWVSSVDVFFRYSSAEALWSPVKIPVTVVWGRAQPQGQQNIGTLGRIVLVPNAPDGSLGALEDPEQPGREPRPLYSQARKFHFRVFGHDIGRPNVPMAQDHAVESLLHNLARNVYLATHFWGDDQITSPVVLGEPAVVKPDSQTPFGVEYMLPGNIQSAVVDQFEDVVQYVDASPAKASTTITIGGTSRTFVSEPQP